MKATIVNCTLKRGAETSNTEALAAANLLAVARALAAQPLPAPAG
jgi:hypothetical protein